jgi:diguanylate cyclase (GGDEF)-like protein/PAS domain S-box-containing protein
MPNLLTQLPRSALARTRFVFWVFALLLLVLAAAMLAFRSDAATSLRVAAALGLAWIAARDLQIQRSGRISVAFLPLDAAALVAVASANGANPSLGVFFLGVYYRSLYGGRGHVAANALAYLGAYVTAALVLPVGSDTTLESGLSQSVGLLLSAFVMSLVADALRREERTRARERLLRQVGANLVSARGCDAIYDTALAAALSVLEGDDGARVVIWRGEADRLRAVAAAGEGADEVRGKTIGLDTLPAENVAELRAGRVVRVDARLPGHARPKLPYRAKTGGVLLVPLQTQGEPLGAMFTGSDQPLPVEVEDTLVAIASQVALALESEELTADLHRRQSEERFSSLIRNASDVITVVSPDRLVRYQTPSVTRVFGYEPEALLGRPITELIHPDDVRGAIAFLERAAARDDTTATGEWRMARQDGAWRRVEVVASNLIEDANVRGLVLTSRDITERKALERRLAYQAFHDSLTGLANRDLFRDRVEHALSRATREGSAAVLFIDVDDFKNVNDTLGHASGDRMLALVAERLRGCVRPGDTAARLGGDEFGVLLEDVRDPDVAVAAATRVLSALEHPLPLGGRDVPVRASVGIALAEPAVASADELLRNADIAMYAAKADGKSRLRLFEPAMYAKTLDRVELHHDLSRAVARQELCLHYQPIVDLTTGRPAGVEALVRWNHRERGLLYPGDFISLAEESGLILPIGRWVLREACRQLRTWRAQDPAARDLKMSVNLSPGQLVEPRLTDDVAAALSDYELKPDALVIEITESAMMEDVEVSISRLDQLASLGVRLALDDFGTGYSSLSYLQRFPLDVLKLDRSFTDELRAEVHESRLPRAMIELGHTLGMTIVAEGVEEASQADRLLELGCRLAQGYHFARPAPADRLLAVLAELRDEPLVDARAG